MQISDYDATKPIIEDASPISSGGRAISGDEATATTNDDVISTLNNLIETCKDGQNGFQEAAESVERSDLKSIFYEYSQQRAQFAGELQSLVRELGGEPQTSGSTAAMLHRRWIDVKSAITGKDDTSILNECERGEDSAKANYKDALQAALPANVAEVVQRQYSAVQEAHDRVKSLRDSSKAANT